MTTDRIGSRRPMTVAIRRDMGRKVRPGAEQVDGHTYVFTYGWLMAAEDPYPGEIAWVPADQHWPADAPTWIAGGDLRKAT